MSLSRKAASSLVAGTALAFAVGGMGTANAGVDYYGSIAVSFDGAGYIHAAVATDYPSQAEADAAALSHCGYTPCSVQVQWANGCAAIAARDLKYWSATAPTREEAIAVALSGTGPDPNPIMVSLGSSEPSTAQLVGSECTSNAE